MHGPGAVTERMVVLIPRSKEKARFASSVQGGVYHPEGSPPALSSAGDSQLLWGNDSRSLPHLKKNDLTLQHDLWVHMVMHVYFCRPDFLERHRLVNGDSYWLVIEWKYLRVEWRFSVLVGVILVLVKFRYESRSMAY